MNKAQLLKYVNEELKRFKSNNISICIGIKLSQGVRKYFIDHGIDVIQEFAGYWKFQRIK